MTILSELPGLTKDQVGISLENNRLTISGQTKRSQEYEVEGVRQGYKERTFSSFSRSFNVPSGLKAEEIKAGLEVRTFSFDAVRLVLIRLSDLAVLVLRASTEQNGVLKVTFPKNVEKPEAKKIEILSHL